MTTSSPPRYSRRPSLACALAASLSFLTPSLQTARAQTSAGRPDDQLDTFITTATRTPVASRQLGTAVDVISAAELNRRQISSLAGALGVATGAPLFASGQAGGLASLFLRGANSNQTLFLVDGVRFNDPNTDYQVFLGGSCVGACDSLEISHGPQSTLYGGEAVGGVVALRSLPGRGAPTAKTSLEAGSFGTVQGAVSAQGERGPWGYSFSAVGGHTDNDRPNNAFDSGNVTLRLDRKLTADLTLGGTVRGFVGHYGSPGDRFTNDPDNTEEENNWLGTFFAEFAPASGWRSRVTLAGQDRRFVAESPRAGRPTSRTVVTNRRGVLDWQNTFTGIERHRITAGLTAEANHTRNTGFGSINRKQTLHAFFAQDEFTPVESVFLTAGLRSDDYDTFGRATTGRGTAAWMILPDRLKVRASYGTSFRAPSFLDLYGESAFYQGNPNLNAERARGWDAGVDYYLPKHAGVLSATWFENRFRDLIASSADFRSVVNIQRAKTRGLEVSAQAPLPGAVVARIAYTYLEADDLTGGRRLLRRPAHSANVDLSRDFAHGLSGGVGVTWVAGREDVNAATFARLDGEDYTVVRVYGAWRATEKLTVKARVENLLDENYEQVNGYPQLGLGAFAGIEWAW